MFDLYLPGFQSGPASAPARMTSTATIRRKTGATVDDPTTGLQVPEWVVTHQAIPCRLPGAQRGRSQAVRVTVGSGEVELGSRELHLPHDTTNVHDGDLAEITSGVAAGTVWRISDADPADQQTARRLDVTATDRPKEWP